MNRKGAAVVNSALWSAYGDSLGFITELATTANEIRSRSGLSKIITTVPWTRRIGGRFGVECSLPAGCYSDDTQLRLAGCRTIRSDGSFDVEAFGKMELPVWNGYALGAGRGSKAAASALSKDGVTWFSNFYDVRGLSYVLSGGNGGAMRIQPHVWAASEKSPLTCIVSHIVKNIVCTHGHPRAILGGVFHGLVLKYTMDYGVVPSLKQCMGLIDDLNLVPDVVESDPEMKLFWLPVWESKTNSSFKEACRKVQDELRRDLGILERIPLNDPGKFYKKSVEQLGGLNENERGSGTKTALLALALAFAYGPADIVDALTISANFLGSDTDSIATMAGALLGSLAEVEPAGDILDREYIRSMAERCAEISSGKSVDHIQYPDLMEWKPPRTQQDCVVGTDSGLEVLILGRVISEGDTFVSRSANPGIWQWLRVESGQTVLIKRKQTPDPLRDSKQTTTRSVAAKERPHKQEDLKMQTTENKQEGKSIDDLTREAIRSGFDPSLIGSHILLLCESSEGVEKTIAYAAIIAKARIARRTKR